MTVTVCKFCISYTGLHKRVHLSFFLLAEISAISVFKSDVAILWKQMTLKIVLFSFCMHITDVLHCFYYDAVKIWHTCFNFVGCPCGNKVYEFFFLRFLKKLIALDLNVWLTVLVARSSASLLCKEWGIVLQEIEFCLVVIIVVKSRC